MNVPIWLCETNNERIDIHKFDKIKRDASVMSKVITTLMKKMEQIKRTLKKELIYSKYIENNGKTN